MQPPSNYHDGGANPASVYQQGAVLMVYGLNMEKVNCQKLFNLFCLYGNIVKVCQLICRELIPLFFSKADLINKCRHFILTIHLFLSTHSPHYGRSTILPPYIHRGRHRLNLLDIIQLTLHLLCFKALKLFIGLYLLYWIVCVSLLKWVSPTTVCIW